VSKHLTQSGEKKKGKKDHPSRQGGKETLDPYPRENPDAGEVKPTKKKKSKNRGKKGIPFFILRKKKEK